MCHWAKYRNIILPNLSTWSSSFGAVSECKWFGPGPAPNIPNLQVTRQPSNDLYDQDYYVCRISDASHHDFASFCSSQLLADLKCHIALWICHIALILPILLHSCHILCLLPQFLNYPPHSNSINSNLSLVSVAKPSDCLSALFSLYAASWTPVLFPRNFFWGHESRNRKNPHLTFPFLTSLPFSRDLAQNALSIQVFSLILAPYTSNNYSYHCRIHSHRSTCPRIHCPKTPSHPCQYHLLPLQLLSRNWKILISYY